MRRLTGFCLLLLGTNALADDRFDLSIPEGWHDVSGSVRGALRALAEQQRANERWHLASFVVTEAPVSQAFSAEQCAATGQQLHQALGVAIEGAALEDVGSLGKRCRIAGHDVNDPTFQMRWTVIPAGKTSFVVTCNFDQRDEAAPRACDAILASWRNR